jgi:hypothetical protein
MIETAWDYQYALGDPRVVWYPEQNSSGDYHLSFMSDAEMYCAMPCNAPVSAQDPAG